MHPHEFAVLGGEDAFLLPTVLMGGAGRDLRRRRTSAPSASSR